MYCSWRRRPSQPLRQLDRREPLVVDLHEALAERLELVHLALELGLARSFFAFGCLHRRPHGRVPV
jgi:hypothetical protein